MSAPATNPQAGLIVAVTALASAVAFLDGTVVNVALPAMSDELGGGLATQQWTVDAYLLTLSALILFAGSVSDAFGRLLVLRIGLIGFGVASLAVGLAPDPVTLIIARAVQGAAGAFLVPSSLALITSQLNGPAQSKAIGQWTAWTTAATLAGPLLGGVFVDTLSWRFAFLVNVIPIAITFVLLARLRIDDHRRPDARIDVLSALLCTLGLAGIVFALIEQPNLGWSNRLIWMPLVGGAALFGAFLLRQRTASSPILPLDIFTVRNFWTGNLSTFFVYAALSLNGFVVGVYLQQGAGLSATLAGLASLPATVLLFALSSWAGGLSARLGPRLFMTAGPLVMAGGALLLLTVREDFDYWTQVLPGLFVFGLGLAFTVSPLTAAILGAIGGERSGIASATNNAVSRIAGLVVIAVLATIVGGSLDLEGFHRAALVTAALMAAGAVVALVGIRNPSRVTDE
ncbi:MFS transporter [Microbacterium sp. EYE_5]|uniref:MFS transporter n=1 Tax=unclassified Microbacterium TaxID=2609290 RepID=UPI002005E010|nr:MULTISPECIES: MFS transporter [unclassified Microbacterium]MCK6079815.1 MFS transporter [Microbacterium sp. EYE_382]MCK6085086.1 MFS transporter [Microbacterium sp. EYE_384]MCK6122688.1 MFS transporter [Microbacterium sp. EYE_80]MCK6125849.1 MFS transporter [Microbacterium sp. EYE_79]MCK6140770.1 MFS transporter [Microbacterium sp. EYE_39]